MTRPVVAVWVGGPHDGAMTGLADPHTPVRVAVRRADTPGAPFQHVDVQPVNTALGWRLYWPRGLS